MVGTLRFFFVGGMPLLVRGAECLARVVLIVRRVWYRADSVERQADAILE
jgi:hypothetical protein